MLHKDTLLRLTNYSECRRGFSLTWSIVSRRTGPYIEYVNTNVRLHFRIQIWILIFHVQPRLSASGEASVPLHAHTRTNAKQRVIAKRSGFLRPRNGLVGKRKKKKKWIYVMGPIPSTWIFDVLQPPKLCPRFPCNNKTDIYHRSHRTIDSNDKKAQYHQSVNTINAKKPNPWTQKYTKKLSLSIS